VADQFSLEYWEFRAAEALAAAMQLNDPECRRVMLDIAASYREMAAAAVRLRRYSHTPDCNGLHLEAIEPSEAPPR
jgi:hypothetical protein